MTSSKTLFHKTFFSFFLIFAACLLLYGRTLNFGFVWDDFGLIVKTDALRKWSNLGNFFTVPYWILATGEMVPYHRPMAPLLILFTSCFSGIQPWGYHTVSVLLFMGTAFLFYQFLKSLSLGTYVAEIAVAVFIAHPVNAETVSWVCCQPTLVSGFCFIALLWLSSRLQPGNTGKTFPAIAFFYITGLFSYHSIMNLPFLVFFRDLTNPALKASKTSKLRWMEYALYFFLTLFFILYNQMLIQKIAGIGHIRPFYVDANANIVYSGNLIDYFLAPLNTISRYSETLLFPIRLFPDAYFRAADLRLSSLAALLLIGLSIFLLMRSKVKGAGFSGLWMLCGLITVSNLVPSGGLFADRYIFISLMGFALWAGIAFQFLITRFAESKRAILMLLMAILLALGVKTFQHCEIWQSDFQFWYYASQLTPHKARNHYYLATWWEKAGQYAEAAKEYQKALDLDPENFSNAKKHLAEVTAKLSP